MKRRWWWQRIHPVFRVLLAIVYFGLAFSVIAYAVAQGTPDSASAQQSASTESPVDDATATTTPAPATTTQDTAPDTEASGKELYDDNCAACHGADLEGGAGPPLDRTSDASELSDARYVLRISDGIGAMPGFSDQLTSDEIDEVIAYIRDEQGG
jgi:mono/diheme cytochrome c family protein